MQPVNVEKPSFYYGGTCREALMPIGSFLETVAKSKIVVTYYSLITKFKLPPLNGNCSVHPLYAIFEQLDQEDANNRCPFRTSVVVRKDSANQMPGGGFFDALELLKGIRCLNDFARQ